MRNEIYFQFHFVCDARVCIYYTLYMIVCVCETIIVPVATGAWQHIAIPLATKTEKKAKKNEEEEKEKRKRYRKVC